ncbi:epimerase [Lysinibacillus sp. PLM2]|nr:epimerase [Lysinibacillus sp. PLM2]
MLLITGITGHTGGYFLQELIKNNYNGPIRCIVRKTSDTALIDKSGLNIEKVYGDITDLNFLEKCMKGIKTVFHIINIRHTLTILKVALKHDVSRMICVHTTGIYSKFRNASSEYIEIEGQIKKIVNDSKIKMTILRPTMIYGDLCDHNMSKFIKMVDKFPIFPVINKGSCLIQPVNARDLGKAYYAVLMTDSETLKYEYNLSGHNPITMLKSFQLISKNLNKKRIFINCPLSIGVLLAKILKLSTFSKIDYIEKVQRMSEDRCFSHEDAKNDFNYQTERFEIGIEREVKQYLERRSRII